mgnify:CR=1 FL=1
MEKEEINETIKKCHAEINDEDDDYPKASSLGKNLINKLNLLILRTERIDEQLIHLNHNLYNGPLTNSWELEYEKRISELEGTVKTLKEILKGYLERN